MTFMHPMAMLALTSAFRMAAAGGPVAAPDNTCFQTGGSYSPEVDIASDEAIVYGAGNDFAERAAKWREQGYAVAVMTGVAWGGYDAYFGSGDAFKKDEVQTVKSGKLLMHGDSATIGYNVPTPAYTEFLKHYLDPAIDAGVRAVYLEEPEYWVAAGWSPAFKNEWQQFYGEPWQAPDSSVDAQYRASKLKYELYFRALKDVFAYTKDRAKARGAEIACVVPTHSLVNYAHWGIVSPESHLVDIPQLDGYIAQVWTGTARTPNFYRGVAKERTFETAFLEYGQMADMVRPTKRKVWFLADPVEDNPNRSWGDYKRNYECTLIASLLWPEVHRFEVMPWPQRIFQGAYPKLDLESNSGTREGIPADYATQVLILINALNEMAQADVTYETGTRGIGVLLSDTAMFQRGEPSPSDQDLGSFFALAMPLVKAGIPVQVAQLENVVHPDALKDCKVLLLTYEHQKPLKPEYHAALDAWVRGGGGLIHVEDGSDPYHGVREWWNDSGRINAKAYEDLFKRLGVTDLAYTRPQQVGKGYVRVVHERPRDLQHQTDGADKVMGWVAEMLGCLGEPLRTQNFLTVRRGPFVVSAVMDESTSDEPLRRSGKFVNLLDPSLPVVSESVLRPNERGLLYDLDWWARRSEIKGKVVAAGARVRDEQMERGRFRFTARGPRATTATARILLPAPPVEIVTQPPVDVQQHWDAPSGTLGMSFPNTADDIRFTVVLPAP